MTVENSGDGVEQTYIKNDLSDYIEAGYLNLDAVEHFDFVSDKDVERYSEQELPIYIKLKEERDDGNFWKYSRTSALEAVLPFEAEVYSEASGRYTGEMVHIIDLDGYVWMAHDYYGSCSYCDGFIDNKVGWTEKQLRRFYCFETTDDALSYLETTDDFGYEATELKPEARRVLTEVIQHE